MSNELVIADSTWAALERQAEMLLKSGFLPAEVKTTAQAVAIALKGRELGLPIMQAFASIHVIKGKPSLSAEGMLALAFARLPGFAFTVEASDDKSCTVVAVRPGGAPHRSTFTFGEAVKAGITSNPSWTKYPKDMLRHRATTRALRVVCPDVVAGLVSADEADDTVEGTVVSARVVEERAPRGSFTTETRSARLTPRQARAAEQAPRPTATPAATATKAAPAKSPASASPVEQEYSPDELRAALLARLVDPALVAKVLEVEDEQLAGPLVPVVCKALATRCGGDDALHAAADSVLVEGRKWDELTMGELLDVTLAMPPATTTSEAPAVGSPS